MASSAVRWLEVSMPSVITTTARRPSPWLARSRAACSRASCSAVDPYGSISAMARRISSRSVVKRTTPQYLLSKAASAASSRGWSAPRICTAAMRVLVDLSAPFMLPLASKSSRMRARESVEEEKCSSFWGRPSSKMRSSPGLRSTTGRPWESTAVAERVTRAVLAAKRGICCARPAAGNRPMPRSRAMARRAFPRILKANRAV